MKIKITFFLLIIYFNTKSQIRFLEGGQNGCAPFNIVVVNDPNPGGFHTWNFNSSSTITDTFRFLITTTGSFTLSVNSGASITINSLNKPTGNLLTNKDSGCLPFIFNASTNIIYPSGISPITEKWIFNDGSEAIGNNVWHSIQTKEGNISASFDVITSPPSCNFRINKNNYLFTLEVPKTKFTISDTFSCFIPKTISLQNLSTHTALQNVKYEWNWQNNGNQSSTNFNINNQTLNQEGTFNFSLKTTNQLGCSSQFSKTLKIERPNVGFTTVDTFCQSDIKFKLFINNFDTNYVYTYYSNNYAKSGDLGPLSDSNEFYNMVSLRNNFPLSIIKTLKSNSLCSDTMTKNIFLLEYKPTIKFSTAQICNFPFIFKPKTLVFDPLIKNYDWKFKVYDYLNKMIQSDSSTLEEPTFIGAFSNKKDSFYRRSVLLVDIQIGVFSQDFSCKSYSNSMENFYPFSTYLVATKTSMCKGGDLKIMARSTKHHKIKKVSWFVNNNPLSPSSSDSIISQTFNQSGTFRYFAVVESQTGCLDTTQILNITIYDSIILNKNTTFSVSKNNLCAPDSLIIKNTLQDSFDHFHLWFNNKPYYWKKGDSLVIKNFENRPQNIITYVAQNGNCNSIVRDTISLNSAATRIGYHYNCNERNRFYFYEDSGLNANTYIWNYGDGNSYTKSSKDTHSYQYMTRGDYWVSLTSKNAANNCEYKDSVKIHVRFVKAIIDTPRYKCRVVNESVHNGFPYLVNPNLSKDAEYQCSYLYTWFFENAKSPIRSYTVRDSAEIDFPKKSFTLGLVARDFYGCTDTARMAYAFDSFSFSYQLNKPVYCLDDTLKLKNTSYSKHPILISDWRLELIEDGNYVFLKGGSGLEINFPVKINRIDKDSIVLTLKTKDTGTYCLDETATISVPFYSNDQKSIFSELNDSVCVGLKTILNYKDSFKPNNDYIWFNPLFDTIKKADTFVEIEFNQLGKRKYTLHTIHKSYQCRDTIIKEFVVMPKMRLFDSISTASKPFLCFPETARVFIDDSSQSNYSVNWYLNTFNNSVGILPSSTIALEKGLNSIWGVIKNNYSCLDTVSFSALVINPSADIILSEDSICKKDALIIKPINAIDVDSFYWNLGYQNVYASKSDTSFSVNFKNKSLTSDSVLISAIFYSPGNQCVSSYSKTIKIYESKTILNKTIDTFCHLNGESLNLSDSGLNHQWYINNIFYSNTKNLNTSNLLPGGYLAKLISNNKTLTRCKDTSILDLTILPNPKLIFKNDTVCFGDSLNLNIQDTLSNTFLFFNPKLISDSLKLPVKIKPTENQLYQIKSKSRFGCLDSISYEIFVVNPIVLDSLDTIVAQGQKVILPLDYQSNYIYKWNPTPDSINCLHCTNPELKIIDSVFIRLSATDFKGCFENNTFYRIRVYPDIHIKVPAAFTPNGDGNNDILFARGFGIKKLIFFKTFNRQGQLIFETNNENFGWDGTYKGLLQNQDVYFYTYEAESYTPGKIINGEGSFMLLK